MTKEEIQIVLPEFRDLWVNQLCSVEDLASRFDMSKAQVWYWSQATGLNKERKRAMANDERRRRVKKANYERSKMRAASERQKRGNGEYIPPEGFCLYCPLQDACKRYHTWMFDAGLPCEILLPEEEKAIATGGYERSELPNRSAFKVRVHMDESK